MIAAFSGGTLVEVIGWTGSIVVILAYAMLSGNVLRSTSLRYQFLNVVGALGLVINGWAHGALPSVFNNILWVTIGTIALIGTILRRSGA